MKCLILLSIAIAACAASVIQNSRTGDKQDNSSFYFPGDGDGILHYIDGNEPIDYDFIDEYTRDPNNNAYWLYTRNNPTSPQILRFGDVSSIFYSNFNFLKVTVFLAHGWNGHGANDMNTQLTEAFLTNADVNVIVLDWSQLANRSYRTARQGTPAVGKGLGQFVNWLATIGLNYERVHLVGFSLGGHLVGNAGRETGSQVRRITALDPAGPNWSSTSERVVPTDGRYVEVIHTNTGLYGYSDPCGDADFYPNGGSGMPGCWVSSCSHSRAWQYMASTVKYNHLLANECATIREANRDRCTGDLFPMGNSNLQKTRTGIFRVNTARNYPY